MSRKELEDVLSKKPSLLPRPTKHKPLITREKIVVTFNDRHIEYKSEGS